MKLLFTDRHRPPTARGFCNRTVEHSRENFQWPIVKLMLIFAQELY